MSYSGPGARTGGDRETCRYCPGSKALVPHVYGVLSVLLPYRICQRSLVTLCLDYRVTCDLWVTIHWSLCEDDIL